MKPFLAAAVLFLSAPLAASTPGPLHTLAERSGFERTGRYDETVALCAAFQRRHPDAVRCLDFGTTPEGRPMKVLVVSRSGALTPEAARERGIPVVLMQGGIHAGEVDGKDAGFLALREVLHGRAAPGALEHLVWLFVPVFNIDGHERFGPWNRPNQRGPEQMGWRTTAQNFNLNRDYAKADSPEMRAMLRLVGEWDPIATIDLHATDGAQFEHDISIQVEPLYGGDEGLRAAGRSLRDRTVADLEAQGSLPLPYYPSFEDYEDPASGFEDGVSPPRFSTGYFLLRNRLAMLVETHSWKEYPVRVRITRNTIVSILGQVARNGREWMALARAADARDLSGQPVALDYTATDESRIVEFRGYAYTRTPSEVSGALMTRYDETTPQVWKVPLRDVVVPKTVVEAPRAGYLVPPAHAAMVAERLDAHGIDFRRLGCEAPSDCGMRPAREVEVQVFRATAKRFAATPVESHQRLSVEGAWLPEIRPLRPGALFVPIAQPKARLVMALLEPQAPDSLLQWGLFNNAFERKEYMEAYVAEDVARQMLEVDPELREAFGRRLREDPDFAGDPSARLEFFYRRHPSWDEQLDLYPVMRVDRAPD
ncbi:putative carboxypeptidase [Luteimonas sp. J16]|uniref:M14 family metallopeptidase n=1 Tax=unclassified Luteimonas TaxID=2629088 RepID=UPI00047CC0B3|nr:MULTISPECIES: M14 family metallopeptidase [unclassified Luteimonas]TWG88711.1 putative carboxypeptidase [Luteimonas sp. J16]